MKDMIPKDAAKGELQSPGTHTTSYGASAVLGWGLTNRL